MIAQWRRQLCCNSARLLWAIGTIFHSQLIEQRMVRRLKKAALAQQHEAKLVMD